MHFQNFLKCLSLFAVILLSGNIAFSQFFGPFGSVDYPASTGYGEDTVFVYYSDNPNKLLAAQHSTGDTATFAWSRFNKETESFDSLLTHQSSPSSEIMLDSLYEKGMLKDTVEGLRVNINDGDSLEQYTCWVVMDTLPEISDIWIEDNTCDRLWLAVDAFTFDEYFYYDLSDSPYEKIKLRNERTVKWSASKDVNIFDPATLYNYGNILIGKIGQVNLYGEKIPYEESDYYLKVTNSFGNAHEDTIENVPAKAVKADFGVLKVLPDGTEEAYSQSAINEALLQVKFENKSENADSYQWTGYNDSILYSNGSDRILWKNFQETPSIDSIPKYKPGKYQVKLQTGNEYGCVDSMNFYHIEVDSSKIDTSMIPNVFTPNGDGTNDVFVLPKKSNITNPGDPRGVVSMKRIEVTVLNRSGELVYKYEGNPDDWEGWKGKVKNGNRDAAEGIYVYVIIGKGYDGVEHENKRYTGILYLYR
jgi:hypothetical protein